MTADRVRAAVAGGAATWQEVAALAGVGPRRASEVGRALGVTPVRAGGAARERHLSVRVHATALARLDEHAGRVGASRSEYARRLLAAALTDRALIQRVEVDRKTRPGDLPDTAVQSD